MKTSPILMVIGLFLGAIWCCWDVLGQVSPDNAAAEPMDNKQTGLTNQERSERDFVRTAEFHLRDGRLIFGKLISEDKNKVTIERIEEGAVVVWTYAKRDIDTRTMNIRNIPAYKHYLDLAEYFSGSTWDFKNDPDDFIQAIRCYEKAKQLLSASQTDQTDRVTVIDEQIKKLNQDREIWLREAQSRAELKKVETEAAIDSRLQQIEKLITESSEKMKALDEFSKAVVAIQEDYKNLQNEFYDLDDYVSRELDTLADRIEDTRRLVDGVGYLRYYYPKYYSYPSPRTRSRGTEEEDIDREP